MKTYDYGNTLEYIMNNVKILDVIENYGLKPIYESDQRYSMLCPFHEENTPSLKIYVDTNTYFCFGCSQGRSVIDFIMNYEHIKFSDVINRYKDKTNMDNGEIILNRIRKSNQDDFNLREYCFSSKYRLGITLREYLKNNQDKIELVDRCFYDMDNFFENSETLDKDRINSFEEDILNRIK